MTAAVANDFGIASYAMKAGEAITANRALKLDSAEHVVLHSTAITDVIVGYSLNTCAINEMVEVAPPGRIVKVACSAGVTLGAQVMPTASGAGKVMTAAGATAKSCGVALTTSTADGEVIEVLSTLCVNGIANS